MAQICHPVVATSFSHFPTINRACQGCNRKKIKCDMTRPVCGLCERVGARCTFPERQKPSNCRNKSAKVSKNKNPSSSTQAPNDHTRYIQVLGRFNKQPHVGDRRTSPPFAENRSRLKDRSPQHQRVVSDTLQTPTSVSTSVQQDDIQLFGPDQMEAISFDRPDLDPVTFLPPTTTFTQRTSPKEVFDSVDKGWHIPGTVAYDLVELFFNNVQSWLPIFHRPTFYQKYMLSSERPMRLVSSQGLGPEETFMMNCIFALAARFSKDDIFKDVDPLLRGDDFAERAALIKDPIIKGLEEPSLVFLKGCVMLTFYNLTAGYAIPGGVLTSVCVRFAFDLGLNDIDEHLFNDDGSLNDHECEEPEAWILKEELRRMWWIIWDLDTFVATLSCQPYGIARVQMKVLLPVSDYHWFNGIPVKSSVLLDRPESTWKSLKQSQNQSARAWYIVSNYLMSCIADAARLAVRQPCKVSADTKSELETGLSCIKLALPAEFQLQSLHIDEQNVVEGNWIISTNLMVVASDILFERLRRCGPQYGASPHVEMDTGTLFGKRFTSQLVRIAQVWPPEFIPLNHPFMCCCMVNPWGTVAASTVSSYELSGLLLSHYSKYWKLGAAMQRLLTILHEGGNIDTRKAGSKDREILKRYSVLDPDSAKRRPSVVLGSQATPRIAAAPSSQGLPSPSLTNFGSPMNMPWPFDIWDNLQGLDMMDRVQPVFMDSPANTQSLERGVEAFTRNAPAERPDILTSTSPQPFTNVFADF